MEVIYKEVDFHKYCPIGIDLANGPDMTGNLGEYQKTDTDEN